MIVEMLFKLFFGLLSFIFNLLPSLNFDGIDWSGLSSFADAIAYINFFIPVDIITACMGLLLIIDNWLFFKNILNWVINKIPFIG